MSSVTIPTVQVPNAPAVSVGPSATAPEAIQARMPVLIDEKVLIPEWVIDQETFRRWARSDEFPSSGWYSYINGMLWVDRTMEQVFSHNAVKGEFSTVLNMLNRTSKSGYFFFDRILLSNPGVGLSTEPDALYFSHETLGSGRIRLVEGATEGFVELEGAPDMILEVVSISSVKKDTEVLPGVYAQAGVREYWLVDARGAEPIFQILQLNDGVYQSTPTDGGWLSSIVFGRAFKLVKGTNLAGHPWFELMVRE